MSPLSRVLAASLIVLVSASVAFLIGTRQDPAVPPTAAPSSPAFIHREEPEGDRGSAPGSQSADLPTAPAPEARTDNAPVEHPHVVSETSVPALEQRIRAARDAEERTELINDLSRIDLADAVMAMERIFSIERHPKVQTSMIAALGEMDAAVQPEARLRILRAAMTNQPRDVRTTALEVLAESKDPRALELLRKAIATDPDHEVREVAAALYKAATR